VRLALVQANKQSASNLLAKRQEDVCLFMIYKYMYTESEVFKCGGSIGRRFIGNVKEFLILN